MKMGAGLGASFWHLGAILGPRWRPRSPRGAPRGAKQANMAPRWANLAPRWVPNWCQNHKKSIEKLIHFLIVFFESNFEWFGSQNRWKIERKIVKNLIEIVLQIRWAKTKKKTLAPGLKSIKNRRKNCIQNRYFRSWFWSRFFIDLGWRFGATWGPKSKKNQWKNNIKH